MTHLAQNSYLHLLKHTLAFTLWPDPLVQITKEQYQHSGMVKRLIVTVLEMLAVRAGLKLARFSQISQEERDEGKAWREYPDTMIGLRRLENIQECIENVLADGVEGDLIETGVWRGGACIFMRGVLAAHGITNRKIYVADSFEGLPPPDEEKHPIDKGDVHHTINFLSVDLETVKSNFSRYGLLDERVIFLKGWFCDTLPIAPIEKLSILRLDGDMYGSTMDALNALYPKLSVGGYCIIDDYHLDGCRKAVDEYRQAHNISQSLQTIDWTGRFWRK